MAPSRPLVPATLVLALAGGLAACTTAESPTAAVAVAAPATQASTTAPSTRGELRVTEVARGLEHPWAVVPLPEGGFLVTERPGRLRLVGADGALSAPIAGVPEVYAERQGGLLDVVLAPDFATSRRVYLTWAESGEGDTAGTAAGYGRLEGNRLVDFTRIYQQQPKLEGGMHFGARIAFDPQGRIYIGQGDRNERPTAQQLDMLQGKVVRLNPDGSIPADNPFVGRADARDEIWSYGHRNIQAMATDPRTGRIWSAEHGPRGGDEINIVEPGKNYGWPLATHGADYTSNRPYPETVGTSAPGTEQPHHVWPKSPALSGMDFLTGQPGSPWNDSLFLGALAGRELIRLQLDGDRIVEEERLLGDRGERIRDVHVGTDGNVYVLTDAEDGALLRIEPPR